MPSGADWDSSSQMALATISFGRFGMKLDEKRWKDVLRCLRWRGNGFGRLESLTFAQASGEMKTLVGCLDPVNAIEFGANFGRRTETSEGGRSLAKSKAPVRS